MKIKNKNKFYSFSLIPVIGLFGLLNSNLLLNQELDFTSQTSLDHQELSSPQTTFPWSNNYFTYNEENFSLQLGDKSGNEKALVSFTAEPKLAENEEKSIWNKILPPDNKTISFSLSKALDSELDATPSAQTFSWLQWFSKNPLAKLFSVKNNSIPTLLKQNNQQYLLYENILPDTDAKYYILKNQGVKEELIIKGTGELKDTFLFDLNLENGVKYFETTETNNPFNLPLHTYYFTDQNLHYLGHFLPIIVKDANGQNCPQANLEIINNGTQLKITIDHDWLLSDIQYPVIIDPSLVYDESVEFSINTAALNRLIDKGSGYNPNLQINYRDIPSMAYWHFDETSGNSPADSSGHNYTATATGTTIVDGKYNKARSFNGSSDYISTPTLPFTGEITVETWIKPGRVDIAQQAITSQGGGWERAGWLLTLNNDKLRWHLGGAGEAYFDTATSISPNVWTHVVALWKNGTMYVYINGVQDTNTASWSQGLMSNSYTHYIGRTDGSSTFYFTGQIDEVQIFSRALSPEEIMTEYQKPRSTYATYTSPVINGGNQQTQWNTISWTEKGVATGNGETPYNTSGLVAQWNFNETSGTTATNNAGSCGASCNGTLTNFADTSGQDTTVNSGWTSNNKRWGSGALMFDGNDDYVSTGSSPIPAGGNVYTLSVWFNQTNQTSGYQEIISEWSSSYNGFFLGTINYDNIRVTDNWDNIEIGTWKSNSWQNIVLISTTDNAYLYFNGILKSTKGSALSYGTNGNLYFGRQGASSGEYYRGFIDLVNVYSRALSADEILSNYQASNIEFQTRSGHTTNTNDDTWEEWRPVAGGTETSLLSLDNDATNWTSSSDDYLNISDDSTKKINGNGSLKINQGQIASDENTVALWHLNETSGSGAYLKDSSGNNNNGTPTGTYLTNGINDKSRNFNGSSDYINIPNSSSLNPTTAITVEFWAKRNSVANNDNERILVKGNSSDDTGSYALSIRNGACHWAIRVDGAWRYYDAGTWTDTNWHHIAGTYDSTTHQYALYKDGVAISTQTLSGLSNYTIDTVSYDLNIGRWAYGSKYFNGTVDEIRISNIARTAEEIAEAYRLGRDHLLTRTIPSTNLSAKTKLPFWVAADRPGNYLETIIGKSAFANNQADDNTVGLWHLEEKSGSGAYLLDSSSYGNNGTPAGTSISDGKIGKSRKINSSSNDYISIDSSASLNITNQLTLQTWVYPTSYQDWDRIISKGWTSDVDPWLTYGLYLSNDNDGLEGVHFSITRNDVGGSILATNSIPLNTWTLITGTYDGSYAKLYINGTLAASNTLTGSIDTNSQPVYIGKNPLNNNNNFNGNIDEPRIDNIARTANEIRQAYEIGRRSHPINIDFVSSPSTSDIKGTSEENAKNDTNFVLKDDNMIGKVFTGDHIIVKENFDGTEYDLTGIVTAVNTTTRILTVNEWNGTIPNQGTGICGGSNTHCFSANATVFKWQREYWDLTGIMDDQLDTTTKLTLRVTNSSQTANIWLDDFVSVSNYLTNPAASVIASSNNQYLQYRAIFNTSDTNFSPSLSNVQISYTDLATVAPKIEQDESGEFISSDPVFERITDTGSSSNPNLETYYQETTSDPMTVGLWHMNETSGTNIADSSGNSNTGTATGTAVTNGIFGQARSFNNTTSDYLKMGDIGDNVFTGTNAKFTIEAWVKPAGTMTSSVIVAKLGDSVLSENQRQWSLSLSTNSKVSFLWYGALDGTSYRSTLGSTPITDTNKWYHISATYDGSQSADNRVSIFVDGQKEITTIDYTAGSPTTIPNGTAQLGIGAAVNTAGTASTYNFNGTIDEVKITGRFVSPEEIRLDALRRPYGAYTSSVKDSGAENSQWKGLSWTEKGVATSDGETDLSTANLVAQWNFNETSGTTANNNAGSCGASCNGTLTNMTTTGQDASPTSGWTANNRKWGTGALMFDGSDDYVDLGKNPTVKNQSKVTISAWVKVNNLNSYHPIFYESNTVSGYTRLNLTVNTDGSVGMFGRDQDGSVSGKTFAQSYINMIKPNTWYYIVGVFDADTDQHKIYINGKDTTSVTNTANSFPNTDPTDTIKIGRDISTYSNSTLDKVSLYFRALSAEEILSNYQAGNIEFQTRTGNTSTPNDGTWEDWKPAGNGVDTQLLSLDNDKDKWNGGLDQYTKLLLHMDGDNASTSFTDKSLYPKTITANGNAQINTSNVKYGSGSGYFDGSGDYLTIPDSDDWYFGNNNFTIDFWAKLTSLPSNDYTIISTQRYDANNRMIIYWDNRDSQSNPGMRFSFNDSGTWYSIDEPSGSAKSYTANTWYHLAFVRNNSNWYLFKNGVLTKTTTISATYPNWNGQFTIGGEPNEGKYFTGYLDDFRISKGLARWTDNFTPPDRAISNPNWLPCQNNSTTIEGIGALQLSPGQAQTDPNTVGLWHLDETGGTGAYLKDSSGKNNNGTPTGTSINNGISNKARSFNGSSDYISIANPSSDLTSGGTKTISAWIKTNSPRGVIFNSYDGSNGYQIYIDTSGNLSLYSNGGSTLTSGTKVNDNKWHHVAGTWDGTTAYIYLDGAQIISGARTISTNTSTEVQIGVQCSGACPTGADYYFNGYIDEVKISNIARTADEIAETYRMGRDSRISRTFDSINLSEKTKLPFWVAADRPGTYLEATIGEGAFANYEPDQYTVGLWHLEEATGSGAYLKDSSNYNNQGTPTGSTQIDGKIGKSRNFSGSTQYITISDNTSIKPTSAITVSTWFNTNNKTTNQRVLSKTESGSYQISLNENSTCPSNTLCFLLNIAGTYRYASYPVSNISNNTWYHVVGLYDGTKIQLYLNGSLVSSGNYTGTITNSTAPLCIGSEASSSACTAGTYFNGMIDEVRIDNIARSASEIRQAFEIGRRTHPVTIDFAAVLDSGNLITGSSDLSFTIDATKYGLSQMGKNLYLGDKIIIKENYDGVEYIAQGIVSGIDTTTGSVGVSSWDSDSTFPSIGFTANATVFKWQQEWWDLTGIMDEQIDGVTRLTIRPTNGDFGKNIWLDDFRTTLPQLTNPAGTSITSGPGRYMQYRFINNSSDLNTSPSISEVSLDYSSNLTLDHASTTESNLTNNNKNNFNIQCNGINYQQSGEIVYCEASWNQTNWYEVDQTISPVTNSDISNKNDIASWTDWPATDETVTLYTRARVGTNISSIRSFSINKDTTNPEVTSISSVSGDTTSPFNDATNNDNTLVVYTASTDANSCKWSESDQTYGAMSHYCESTSNCTLDLSDYGEKNVYMRCRDNVGNENNDTLSPSPTLSYTIGGISMESASTTSQYINNHNKNNFPLSANNVIYETTGSTITTQGSWNQIDWYDITTVASPANDITITGNTDLTSWNNYPVDGTTTIYLRVKGGSSDYSNIKSFIILKDTIDATISGYTSVASDPNPPYVDPTNNQNTLVVNTASDDATACKWDISDSIDYDAMSHICESTTNCTINLEGRGSHTVYFRCLDIHGNKQASYTPLTYTINTATTQPFGWQQTRTIGINPPTAVNNYQVRVELTPNTFDYDNAKEDGSDIKFYDPTDNKLNYWIENWNNQGTSIIWVKVPNIGTDKLNMYYGNYSSTSESNYDETFNKNANSVGLVGWWHLDDNITSTTAIDSSGNNNLATLVNGPVWQNTDGGGWANQSNTHFSEGHHLSFDGTNDYLEISHSSSIDPQVAWTLETWVNRNYLSSQNSLIEKYPNTTGQGGYAMRIGADNKLYGYIINGTASQNCTSTTNILDNSWYHVAVTYDSINNTLACYVNGQLDGYNNSVTYDYMSSSNSSLKIGARGNDAGTTLNGKLDEVRIYNRALPASEIRAEFERRKYHANGPVTTLGGSQLFSEDYASQTDWIDTNWTNRSALTIFNNGNSQSLTDYQVVFNLDTKYLINQNKLQANAADLRFTAADGQTLLPYFIQSGIDNINTKIFVKSPSIGANTQQKIYIYYNNPSATSNSSESILEFYDDFEDNTISDTKWPTKSLGTYLYETGGQMQMTGIRAGNYYLQSPAISSANINLIIEAQTNTPTLPTNCWSPVSWWKSTSAGLGTIECPGSSLGNNYYAWYNGSQDSARSGKNSSESHINQLILKDNYNTTIQSKFSSSYFSDWSADHFDNSQDNYYIRLGARPDNYDPGSIQAMDGRIDWVLARKYTSIEPRVGAYKVAYTTKKGNIDSETWSGTIYIEEPVILNPGQTLTIEPGTIVKFNTDTYLLAENSDITAIGLPYEYIYFTSVHNDSLGTIMDNSTGNPEAGDWNGVYVIGSGNSNFKFCDFGYGGKTNTLDSTNFLGMLNTKENDFTVVNTVFNNSQNADIFGFQSSPHIYRNNLGDSPYGIYLDANNQIISNPIEYNSFANTTISALYIDNLPDTDNNSGPGLVLRNNDIDATNTGFYIQNPSGTSIRDNNAENTINATHNSFKNQSGYMCHYDTAGGNCKFDRTDGGSILFDTNSIILTAPNGNEQWMAGTNHNVTWDINDGMLAGSYLDIYLSPNSGEEFDFTIATNLTCDGSSTGPGCSSGLGTYNWLVSGVPNNEKRLKVVLRNSSGESLAEDISDHNFQINLITDELTNPAPGEESIHNLKFAIPYFWGNQVNGSVQVTIPDEFDLSLSATTVTASGGGVTWNSPNVIGDHTITFPFSGTMNSSGGLITITLGSLNSYILNPVSSGTYPIVVTIHNSSDGSGPAIRRLGTYVNIHNDIGFSFHITPALQLSIRNTSDTQEINRLSFVNPTINTPNDVSHIIKTSTNSHHGYSITVQQLSDMTGPNSAIINAFTATNENPSPWTSPPGGSITGYHGYHTSDNSLSYGTTNRFNNANTWAGLTDTPQEIAYTPNSIQDDITTMTYRLQFTSKQPAGHYEHTILYIITPNY